MTDANEGNKATWCSQTSATCLTSQKSDKATGDRRLSSYRGCGGTWESKKETCLTTNLPNNFIIIHVRLLFGIHGVVGILQEFSVLGVADPYIHNTRQFQQAQGMVVGSGYNDLVVFVREELIRTSVHGAENERCGMGCHSADHRF